MLLTVGDLVEDLIVAAPASMMNDAGLAAAAAGSRIGLRLGADAPVTVTRRRGGSAANVAVGAAKLGRPARFVGQVGDDPVGRHLIGDLAAAGVDPVVRRAGRTGTIVVLCHDDADGVSERTMLTDRGSSVDLDRPEPSWLDGVTQLHLPLYSFVGGELAATSRTVAGWASERGIGLSIDVSATSVIDELGVIDTHRLLDAIAPDVVFANGAEAALLGVGHEPDWLASAVFVEKRGAAPASVRVGGASAFEIPAADLGQVADTTGAGDAFAAGYLIASAGGAEPDEAVAGGHRCAADHLLMISSA
ncbi:MAG: carbohydrate kinase family protein [Acidimicrobiales bacterium]